MTGIGVGIGMPFGNQLGFNPFAVGQPIVLLDAAKGITLNGADVSGWADQSGQGNSVTQSTAADQPLWIASDANFNGQPSVQADGLTETLSTGGAFTGGELVQPNTIIMVYKFADNVGTQLAFDGNVSTTKRSYFITSGTQGGMYAGLTENIHTEDTNPHIGMFLFNAASSDSFRDGIQTTPAGSVGGASMNGLNLFADWTELVVRAAVTTPFFAIYNSNLSDAAKNYIGNGLAGRFGTTWTDI